MNTVPTAWSRCSGVQGFGAGGSGVYVDPDGRIAKTECTVVPKGGDQDLEGFRVRHLGAQIDFPHTTALPEPCKAKSQNGSTWIFARSSGFHLLPI